MEWRVMEASYNSELLPGLCHEASPGGGGVQEAGPAREPHLFLLACKCSSKNNGSTQWFLFAIHP
ncbi:hypothetical protein E2C01_089900 [Portunus trituberculatus]|uniref:Uncharacterized protein n=1 Tax=Portunus trituberculatus TaxID=210409 RepID=A0A5B7JIV2_PORTR|nr:hypothetical protein [Portunus trituberculatus]